MTCIFIREAEGNLTAQRRGGGNLTTESEIRMLWLHVKGFWYPPEAARVKGQKILP